MDNVSLAISAAACLLSCVSFYYTRKTARINREIERIRAERRPRTATAAGMETIEAEERSSGGGAR